MRKETELVAAKNGRATGKNVIQNSLKLWTVRRWHDKTYPKIRLQGHWLAGLGFTPGSRVAIIPKAAGELTMQVERPTPTEPSSKRPDMTH